MVARPKYPVMLSGTYKELVPHRQALRDALLGQDLFPVAMENDAALPDHDLISASLAKIDEADGYVGLISYRYGQAPADARNPDELSLTELEFRRALERKIPICMFIMHDDHAVPRSAVDAENDAQRAKLKAFVELARKDRIYAEFQSVDDLKAKAVQSLVKLRQSIETRASGPAPAPEPAKPAPKPIEVPPGWEIVDREALARIRANPPSLNEMVQFFDGILPTWQFVLAHGVQSRAIAGRLTGRLRAIHDGAAKPQVVLVAGAGGEGKSTAVLQAAAALVEDAQQAWTCFHRRATNAELPEDAFANLPAMPNHAWVVVIDDADNIGPAILAAVKKVDARTDVHLLLAARDAEWRLKRLVPGLWQPFADFHNEPLVGLDDEDARRIVAGWAGWGDKAMGKLKGRSEAEAVVALLGHARDFAARKEDGELLGALLVTRQGQDMRAHVRTLVNGLGRKPVIKSHSLRDIYTMVAAMHAENQLYLSRSVLAAALGSDVDELERKALLTLRREAMLDSGDVYVLTRHRRIAEAACAVMREDDDDVDRWFPVLARAARRAFAKRTFDVPEIRQWTFDLARHFAEMDPRWWTVARNVARSVYEADPANVQSLTALASILRDTGRAAEALAFLKATGEKFRNHRNVLSEWGTVGGKAGDHGLAAWLGGRALADGGEELTPKSCMMCLRGLSVAFRELEKKHGVAAFATATVGCGEIGVRLPELGAQAQEGFEKDRAYTHNPAGLPLDKAIEAIRQAVILGADEVDPDNDPVFFEKLLGDPGGYRYTALLRVVAAPQQHKGRRG
ncbi:MAG TPA: DUF4062 domain-containing protein [Rhizomicrobium sp.]|nr:DUF4062 domain-containing protein [Rhizomicrobium sp.]